jgi:segregation and condensation protein B
LASPAADAESASPASAAERIAGLDVGDGSPVPAGDAPGAIPLESVIEGLLFVSGEPLPLERIAGAIGLAAVDARAVLDNMAVFLKNSKRGLMLREINGKYQLCTRPEIGPYVAKLFEARQKHGLSQAAYETLSVVAYNKNATRALVERIRGVNSDSAFAKLLDRGLIREAGRLRVPGRPMAYDVTDEFFRVFGFKSRKDLPDLSSPEPLDTQVPEPPAAPAPEPPAATAPEPRDDLAPEPIAPPAAPAPEPPAAPVPEPRDDLAPEPIDPPAAPAPEPPVAPAPEPPAATAPEPRDDLAPEPTAPPALGSLFAPAPPAHVNE